MLSPGNPQSLNRYSYVLNNPLKYTDPTGHGEEEEDWKPDFNEPDPWEGVLPNYKGYVPKSSVKSGYKVRRDISGAIIVYVPEGSIPAKIMGKLPTG